MMEKFKTLSGFVLIGFLMLISACKSRSELYILPIEYNAEADSNSWLDMKAFLSQTFNK